ncbi:MAG: DUF3991 domain-containing protein [Thermodesulfobacteriota bacterium]
MDSAGHIISAKFEGCVRVDQRHNTLFPQHDKDSLCGFEIKNQGFSGFAPGGVKGLWYSKTKPSDHSTMKG